MLAYATLGMNDMPRAAAFYDALPGVIGGKRTMQLERGIVWGVDPRQPMLGVLTPFDRRPATVGHGVMVALVAASPTEVDALYCKAIELGAKDEGAAGPRGGFYVRHFRDSDGNKLNAFGMA